MIPKVTVETDDSLTSFQSKVVWVDAQQNAHEQFNDLSEPVTDYDDQGKKLEVKFASLCDYSRSDSAAQARRVASLLRAAKVSIQDANQ